MASPVMTVRMHVCNMQKHHSMPAAEAEAVTWPGRLLYKADCLGAHCGKQAHFPVSNSGQCPALT